MQMILFKWKKYGYLILIGIAALLGLYFYSKARKRFAELQRLKIQAIRDDNKEEKERVEKEIKAVSAVIDSNNKKIENFKKEKNKIKAMRETIKYDKPENAEELRKLWEKL